MRTRAIFILAFVIGAVTVGSVLSSWAQDEGGAPAQQQAVCSEYTATTNTAANAKMPDGSTKAINKGAEIKFSMTDGIWPYASGDELQLGSGTPIKWRDVPEAPWQQGIAEAPIMITLQ